MQYRKFGKLDWEVSALGFGCMRLPVLDGKRNCIDIPTATRMIHSGIEGGINYLDTAYTYHDGESEKLVGDILTSDHRRKVKLATKMPSWLIKEKGDFDMYFEEQLGRLKTERIDFYLVHTLNLAYWENLLRLGVLDWLQRKKDKGYIGAIGFSFHDEFPIFKRIIDEFEYWDFCQIQYNYLDIEEQAGLSGLKYASERGLAVIVMEPLLGGKLAVPPPAIQSIFTTADRLRSPVDWALQWIWDQPEVSVILSGMTSTLQVKENLECADRSKVGSFSKLEGEVIRSVQDAFYQICPIPCTNCQYCMPCPHGVNIPLNFEVFNRGIMLDDIKSMKYTYGELDAAERASACQHCHDCEDKCPQRIPISDWMSYIHEVLGESRIYSCEEQPPRTRTS